VAVAIAVAAYLLGGIPLMIVGMTDPGPLGYSMPVEYEMPMDHGAATDGHSGH
jgi:hypothetical protein